MGNRWHRLWRTWPRRNCSPVRRNCFPVETRLAQKSRLAPALRSVETNSSLRRPLRRLAIRTRVRTIVETHRLADFVHRCACDLTSASRASFQNIPGEARIVLVFFPALLHGVKNFYQGVRSPALALDAANSRRPPTFLYSRPRLFRAQYFVQFAHRP